MKCVAHITRQPAENSNDWSGSAVVTFLNSCASPESPRDLWSLVLETPHGDCTGSFMDMPTMEVESSSTSLTLGSISCLNLVVLSNHKSHWELSCYCQHQIATHKTYNLPYEASTRIRASFH